MANQSSADHALKEYQDDLFKNPNLNYLAVVEADPSDAGNTSYILEAGVLDMDKQNRISNNLRGAAEDWSVVVPSKIKIARPARGRDSTADEIAIVIKETPASKPQSFITRERPATTGCSIMNGRYNNAGTLGNIIRVAGSDDLFIFSCWHVLCGHLGTIGDPILQPGILDGGEETDVVGTLHWFRLTNKVDAALARVTDPALVSEISKCGIPMAGVGQAKNSMRVKKCGRTTELTRGVVKSVNSSVRLSGYPGGNVIFVNQILTSEMSQEGDSGAMLIDEATNLVVGMIIGGDGLTQRCANHMSLIFAAGNQRSRALTRSAKPLKSKNIKFESIYQG